MIILALGNNQKIVLDGAWVVFWTKAANLGGSVVRFNTSTHSGSALLPIGGSSGAPAISPGGNYVVVGTSQNVDPRFKSSGTFVALIR